MGWKIKSNTPKEKKERPGEKWGRLKQKNRSAKTETEKGGGTEAKKKKGAETEKKEERCGTEAERKRGLEQRIFQHLFSFKSSQKNYGEFIYVGFNF